MRTLPTAVLAAFLAACSSGGGGSNPPPARLGDVVATTSTDPAAYSGTCAAGTQACGGDSRYCCPTGTACLPHTDLTYGCGAAYCCLGCGAGTACGAGCCGVGTSCVGNPGGPTACGGALCCSPTAEEACPADVAAQCPSNAQCLLNHSARACGGRFACYQPTGVVSCPGETECPNGLDFCPAGKYCTAVSGVCAVGSSGGNYCCEDYAQGGESCDVKLCAPGLSCLSNPHCADTDPTAINTCHGSCAGQTQCGNYCCPPAYPYCSSAYACWCTSW